MKRYNPKDIETKWQQNWDEQKVYQADLHSDKPKYIAMSMFNYPSGAGIHIGHAMNYTISDVKARFKRQQGFESYHPVGWDAFGLPAENYAIKSGVSPQESMATIIPEYHRQYKAMGWSNDWSKELSTHTPEYYRWTQWIFVQMHKNGLAYQDSRMQWWCEKCQTVLANEQVIDGKCWRHDGADDLPVEKKEVKQWFFKITDYADELLTAIDDLDWSDSVKLAQKNWIGKSKGAEVDFAIEGNAGAIKVFTTRPDTLFGATFMVIAPEHELTTEITTPEHQEAVSAYVKAAQTKTEVERQASNEKTGVFTGAYAVNPVNNERVPIWIADYVLPGYGTGAIMAVPAHDERDYEFAQKFDLPVIRVVKNEATDDECTSEEGVMINSGGYEGMASAEARDKIVADLAEKGVATEKTNYKMRDWSVSRQRYWGAPIPIINCNSCGAVPVPEADLPVTLPVLDDFQPSGDGRSALARATDWLKVACPQCAGDAERETDTLDTYIDSSWYMFRYFDPKNDNAIFDSELVKKWEPIDFYNGADHATAHLLYARFIARFFTKIGIIDDPEPFKQFLFNGKVTASDGTMFSKSKGNGVDPLDIIKQGYGADALRTYLMFAAPLDVWVKWDPQGVPGAYRFLTRLWNLVQEFIEAEEGETDDQAAQQLLRATHRMIKKMTDDVENNRYNTAIASAMGALNDVYKMREHMRRNDVWKEVVTSLVACVAPFAPHMSDELWHQMGFTSTVHVDTWPSWKEELIAENMVTVAVQVNGKVRGEVVVPADASQESIVAAAKENKKVAGYIADHEVRKTIYVPKKLVSFVI